MAISIRMPSAGRQRLSALGGFAAVVAGLVALAAPSPALAGAAGTTTLVLNGPAAESLREAGVRVTPLRPARGGARRVVLPVAAGLAGAGTTLLNHRGGIVLRDPAGKSLRLGRLRLALGKRSRLSARLGGRDVDLFRLAGRPASGVDPVDGTVDLAGIALSLTRTGAKAIAAGLPGGLEVRPGRFGTLSVHAAGLLGSGNTGNGAGGGQAQKAAGCPLPGGAGPAPEDPLPVATRPPGATDIAGATIEWHVRESFIRYIGSGEGTSVSGGATADPPVQPPGTSAPLSYAFHFPFAAGWHDAGANPADPTDDTAAIEFGGAVRFLYSAHGIDLTTADPEIEIAGARSRAIFDIAESGGAPERQVLVNLDLSRAAKIEASGSTYTYERVPGAIPSGTAASVFAGFYAPGTDFGCFTVSYSTG